MTSFLQRLQTAQRPLLWLDAAAYAGRLLANGRVPWLDSAEYVAWQRKSQALLDSDVIAVPLAQLAAAWVREHDELPAAMAAKRRITHPVRVLLADEDLRAFVASLVKDLRATFADRVLALVLPAPRVWVAAIHAIAHGTADAPEVDEDEAESGAVYIADFLRAFADCGVDVLLLQESSAVPGIRLEDPSYVPIANLCSHYRWDLGVQGEGESISGENASVAFVIASAPVSFGADAASSSFPIVGGAVSAEFWTNASTPPPSNASFFFAEIPEAADPQRVLERLATLRTS